MRCVSYTRTTSCKNTKKIPSDIIQQQNEHIQNYIQSHGWKLVAKYSDRKKDENENTAFEEMTADGINRKFDTARLPTALLSGGTSLCDSTERFLQYWKKQGRNRRVFQKRENCGTGKEYA